MDIEREESVSVALGGGEGGEATGSLLLLLPLARLLFNGWYEYCLRGMSPGVELLLFELETELDNDWYEYCRRGRWSACEELARGERGNGVVTGVGVCSMDIDDFARKRSGMLIFLVRYGEMRWRIGREVEAGELVKGATVDTWSAAIGDCTDVTR